jgi:hypothetical protein
MGGTGDAVAGVHLGKRVPGVELAQTLDQREHFFWWRCKRRAARQAKAVGLERGISQQRNQGGGFDEHNGFDHGVASGSQAAWVAKSSVELTDWPAFIHTTNGETKNRPSSGPTRETT